VIPVTADLDPARLGFVEPVPYVEPRWDLLADVSWTGWSDFDELRIVRAVGTPLVTPENWDGRYRYSLGPLHHSDKLTLRGGVAFDETRCPTPSALRAYPMRTHLDRIWRAVSPVDEECA